MGGIATDLDGRASLEGLFAVGECACNGLHGANRLASNSLAECFVFGRRAGLAAAARAGPLGDAAQRGAVGPNPVPPASTRTSLWANAGLERTPEGLRALLEDPFPLARLVAQAALHREESRGAHQRTDRRLTDPGLDGMHVVLRQDAEPALEPWR
jgi:L-aspartate oxidase